MFSNTERAKFLSTLVVNIKNILENSQGLSDPENYHEFCRLLARLKTNYQLSELVVVECYPDVIQLIAKFTIQSLQVSARYFTHFFLFFIDSFISIIIIIPYYYRYVILFIDVAICAEFGTLFAITMATYGCINSICSCC